jgi:hypothetical protein
MKNNYFLYILSNPKPPKRIYIFDKILSNDNFIYKGTLINYYYNNNNNYIIVDILEFGGKKLNDLNYSEKIEIINFYKDQLEEILKKSISLINIYFPKQFEILCQKFPNYYFYIIDNKNNKKFIYYNEFKFHKGILYKTNQYEIYEIYKPITYEYLGIAYISNKKDSLFLLNHFKKNESFETEIKFNERFGKWKPIIKN